MQIITTSKRIKQITVLAIICLVSAVGFGIYHYYQQYKAKPEALADHLLQVVSKSASLKGADVDLDAIRLEAKEIILMQLQRDLAATNLPNPEMSASLLANQATSFLAENKTLLGWLTTELQSTPMPTERLEITQPSRSRMEITSNGQCLVIEKNHSHWLLVSVLNCVLTQ